MNLSAQEQSAPDTIVITPQNNYSVATDSTLHIINGETGNDAGAETDEAIIFYNDTLISQYRPIPFDTIQMMNEDKKFYYKSYLDSLLRARQKKIKDQPVNVKPPEDSFFDTLFKLTIWIGAISILVFLIYKLFLSNSSLFSRNRSNTTGEKINAVIENPDDPASMVEDAVRDGNYRLAVRYLFLQTLKNLADKKYIQTGSEKTNYEYVNQIRSQSFANEFASLTLKYEYAWYGEYPLDEELYLQILGAFKNFNKNIGR